MSQVQEDDQSAQVSLTIPACTQSVCSGRDCVLKGRVNGVPANVLVDTGGGHHCFEQVHVGPCSRPRGTAAEYY